MSIKADYYIVRASALPEIYAKVVQAKHLLAAGKAKNPSEATRMAGISRSAFYKYRDCVSVYDPGEGDRVETFYLLLEDIPGVLSSVIRILYQNSCNILTVNQNIPVNGAAVVSISARCPARNSATPDIVSQLEGTSGVVEAKRL